MKLPLQVGVTGGIGSGKSWVCKIFSTLGAPVYDADSQAKKLMESDGLLMDQIKSHFGELSYSKEGALNRKYLSKKVFDDPVKLAQLNQLVHPQIALDYNEWVQRNKHHSYVVKEAALFLETGSYKTLNKIIVVIAPEVLRIMRVLERDRFRDREGILKIMRNQWSDEDKVKQADFVIRNDETELVLPQVLKLHERFIHRDGL